MRSSVTIINSGVCNLDSIRRATEECGGRPIVTDDPRELEQADRIILPGVGSFGAAMKAMNEKGLAAGLRHLLAKRSLPFLGICLGMQLMATKSLEFGDTEGLNLIPGDIVPLNSNDAEDRIPHIGWNTALPTRESSLFKGIDNGRDFYFVHSYRYACANENDVLAETPSYGKFTAAVQHEHLMGVQFHPEKSQRAGFQLLRNFLAV
jgi:glutamine amidotransferase